VTATTRPHTKLSRITAVAIAVGEDDVDSEQSTLNVYLDGDRCSRAPTDAALISLALHAATRRVTLTDV
jgi:hypothetical protein